MYHGANAPHQNRRKDELYRSILSHAQGDDDENGSTKGDDEEEPDPG